VPAVVALAARIVNNCSVTGIVSPVPSTAVVLPLSSVVVFIIPRPHGIVEAS
jgi:hypothetical protein